MFRSLRFRLPALFLAAIVLAGLVATLIAVKLFQNYTRDRKFQELQREATGLARLYGEQAGHAVFSAKSLEEATGDQLFYSGLPLFTGQLRRLPRGVVSNRELQSGRSVKVSFIPAGSHTRYLGIAQPVKLGPQTFGVLAVATPASKLKAGWFRLTERLLLALVAGVALAGVLGWYLSRRITRPVLALRRAADQVAQGHYDIDLPEARGRDEIGVLSCSFRDMARRLEVADELERGFLLTVSHELRTPLTAIRGHVEALREGVAADPESQAASLEVMAAETLRLERLVGDILDLAKLNAHRFTVLREEVDMGRLIDRAYTTFSEEARSRGIDYRREVELEPVVISDGDRVLQIISNLLANAFRWTPDGGRIELAMSGDNGAIAVAVSDNGPGIGAQEQERIFRPFWSRDGRGTGLGLAIARELAVALGGGIELQSEPGHGSRFTLRLPGDYEAVRRSRL